LARLIKADGTKFTVKPRGLKWTLDEIQAFVGGPFEIMPGIAPMRLLMNEEGAIRALPVNLQASRIVLKALRDKPLRYMPTIRGDVLILDPEEKM